VIPGGPEVLRVLNPGAMMAESPYVNRRGYTSIFWRRTAHSGSQTAVYRTNCERVRRLPGSLRRSGACDVQPARNGDPGQHGHGVLPASAGADQSGGRRVRRQMEREADDGRQRRNPGAADSDPRVRSRPERDLCHLLLPRDRLVVLHSGAVSGGADARAGRGTDGGECADVSSAAGEPDHRAEHRGRAGAGDRRACVFPVRRIELLLFGGDADDATDSPGGEPLTRRRHRCSSRCGRAFASCSRIRRSHS
jgi:hypothetical protein